MFCKTCGRPKFDNAKLPKNFTLEYCKCNIYVPKPELCSKTIEACAKLLDDEADKQEEVWDEFVAASGPEEFGTSYHEVVRGCAEKLRKLNNGGPCEG